MRHFRGGFYQVCAILGMVFTTVCGEHYPLPRRVRAGRRSGALQQAVDGGGVKGPAAAGAVLTRLVGSQSYVYPATIFFFAGLSLVVTYSLLKALPAPK